MGFRRRKRGRANHNALAAAYRPFAQDDGEKTAHEFVDDSGLSLRGSHRSFGSKDATLAIFGFRSVERALEDLLPEPSMADLVLGLADGFRESFARDGDQVAFHLMENRPLIENDLPMWRHEWATHLAHGLAAHEGRKRPSFQDRVVSSMAMEVFGIALHEWMHRSSDASLRGLASATVSKLETDLLGPEETPRSN